MGRAGETSVGWKIFLGCVISAGALLMLAVASCVGFVVWMNRPGTLIEPDRLTGPGTVGVVNWTLRLDDPGTQQFVTGVLERLQSARKRTVEGNVPPFFQALSQFQARHNDAKLRAMFPIKAGLVVEPGSELEEGEPQVLGYISLKGVGHQIVFAGWVMRLALGWAGKNSSVDYGGERILTFTEHSANRERAPGVFIHGNDVFFGSRLAVARTAADRLNTSNTAPRPPSRLDDLLAQVPAESALQGAMLNEHGELGRLLGGGIAKPAGKVSILDLLELARQVTIAGGFQHDRSLQIDLTFDCGESGCGRVLEALSHPPATQAEEEETPGGLTLTYTSEGAHGRLHARIQDPAAMIESWVTPPIVRHEAGADLPAEGADAPDGSPDDSRR